MYKEDYKVVIQFDKNGELYWDVYKKGEPHYVGNNKEELQMINDAAEQLKFHVNRLLEVHEKNKHQ